MSSEPKNSHEKHRFKHLYKTAGDVTFIVGRSGKQLTAHKLVLFEASSAFAKMISKQPDGAFTYAKVEPEPFEQMLSFIYRGTCKLSKRFFRQLMYLAHTFSLPELSRHCEQWLEQQDDLKYVVAVFIAKQRLLIPGLEELCARIIRQNMLAAFTLPKFYHVRRQQMHRLIVDHIERLTCNYEQLVEALTEWRRQQLAKDQPKCDDILQAVHDSFAAGRSFGEQHAYQTVSLTWDYPLNSPYYEGTLTAMDTIRIFGVGLYMEAASEQDRLEISVRVIGQVDASMAIPTRSGVYDLLFPAFTLHGGETVKLFVTIPAGWPQQPPGGRYESLKRNRLYNADGELRLFPVDWNFLPVAHVLYEMTDPE